MESKKTVVEEKKKKKIVGCSLEKYTLEIII